MIHFALGATSIYARGFGHALAGTAYRIGATKGSPHATVSSFPFWVLLMGLAPFSSYAASIVSSAQTNPAISRATAMAAVFRSLRTAIFQNL